MRIISGLYKGKRLFLPIDRKTRPLRDLVKESIFNTLTHSKKLDFQFSNKNILDLFSGTGSFGLECLSRNSRLVTFVENGKNALKTLKMNIKKLNLEKKTFVFDNSVFHFLDKIAKIEDGYDLVFLDPPFKSENLSILIKLIKDKKLVNKNGIIIAHRHKKTKDNILENFEFKLEKNYGLSKITFTLFN